MSIFCLIHGSGQHAGVWARLAPELEQRGHQSIAVRLPLDEPDAGARRYAEVVNESLGDTGADVIAVAHSASGLLLPVVAELRPLRRMVFLAALIPRIGSSFMDRFEREGDEMFDAAWIGQDPSTDDVAAMRFIFHDCEPEVARWGLTTRASWYQDGLYEEACPLRGWPTVPSSYIVCDDDRTIRPRWSRGAARALLGVEAVALSGGHCPQVSRPADLADVLVGLASIA